MIRRLSLVLGLVLVVVLAPAAAAQAAPARESVQIVAIVYDPPGPDSGANLRKEIVILKNTGKDAVFLKKWTVSDKAGHTYTFKDVKLKKGDAVTLHTGKGKDTKRHVFWDRKKAVWDNDGDTAFLRDKKDRLVDRCHYDGKKLGVKICLR